MAMMNLALEKKFASYPKRIRPRMEFLRSLILNVASNAEGVGALEETLKWGEPAYLTSNTKSGSTIRIDWKPKQPELYALYVNCKTNLIDSYRSLFPGIFTYKGNRALIFNINDELPEAELRLCISMALRYHLEKQGS